MRKDITIRAMVKKYSLNRFLRARTFRSDRFIFVLFILILIAWFRHKSSESIPPDDAAIFSHRSKIYDTSDAFVMMNLIDQFLDTTDANQRDELWPLFVESWSKSFNSYFRRTEELCLSSSPSSIAFVRRYLRQFTKKFLEDNLAVERHLTGFGLFFDYDPKQMRRKNSHETFEIRLSECLYFDLIVLLMKTQWVLHDLKIDYFISRNTFIGAVRHHDIIPWTSIAELNLPLKEKDMIIQTIPTQFDLVIEKVTESLINQQEIGFVYKIFRKDQSWPFLNVYFYDENDNEVFDSVTNNSSLSRLGRLKKTNVFPVHLRPLGPLLVYSMNTPSSLISKTQLEVCEIPISDSQSSQMLDQNQQRRQMPCEQLASIFEFARATKSWRGGFCEETLKTRQSPYRTLSYFRYFCQENRAIFSH